MMRPCDFRQTMAIAVLDDLMHGQPELQSRREDRPGGHVYEVAGYIDPARLGAFGAQQLENVLEHRHPGLLAHLNGGGTQTITDADVLRALRDASGDKHSPPSEAQIVAAMLALIASRQPYTPGFDDL